jgi:hypothetical protein
MRREKRARLYRRYEHFSNRQTVFPVTLHQINYLVGGYSAAHDDSQRNVWVAVCCSVSSDSLKLSLAICEDELLTEECPMS